jgi:hypothetical protein
MNRSDIKLLPELNASLDFTTMEWLLHGKLLGWSRVDSTPEVCIHIISMISLATSTPPHEIVQQLLNPFRSTKAPSMADFSESKIITDAHCLMPLRHRHLSLWRLVVDIQPEGAATQAPVVPLPNLDIKTTLVIIIKALPAVLLPSLDLKSLPIIRIKAVLELGAQTDPQEGNVTTAAAEDRHNILFK